MIKKPSNPWILVCALLSLSSCERTDLACGPENHGLRLRLEIAAASPDSQRLSLEILNVGQRAFEWKTAACPGDPPQVWLRPFAYYRTRPRVMDRGIQKRFGTPDCRVLEKHLAPGDSFRESFTTSNRQILTDHNWIRFPSPGAYQVVAEVYMPTDSSQFRLVSNPQWFAGRGGTIRPKQSSAWVIRGNRKRGEVWLYLGRGHRIEPGDVFVCSSKGFSSWSFTVTAVGPWTCSADARERVHPDVGISSRMRLPFPRVGTRVELVPEEQHFLSR